jgi:RNA recognition motif-containing protein
VTTVVLSNLPWDATESAVSAFASTVGPVTSVELLYAGTAPIGAACVEFSTEEAALQAFADLQGVPFWNRSVLVSELHERKFRA